MPCRRGLEVRISVQKLRHAIREELARDFLREAADDEMNLSDETLGEFGTYIKRVMQAATDRSIKFFAFEEQIDKRDKPMEQAVLLAIYALGLAGENAGTILQKARIQGLKKVMDVEEKTSGTPAPEGEAEEAEEAEDAMGEGRARRHGALTKGRLMKIIQEEILRHQLRKSPRRKF